MGTMIGSDAENSTWGKKRTMIFDTEGGRLNNTNNTFNLVGNGWGAEDGGFFRCAQWWYFIADPYGNPNFLGPFADVYGVTNPTQSRFQVCAFGFDPDYPGYQTSFLDDDEIQETWVGRDVVLNDATYVMTYDALSTNGSYQVVGNASSSVVSFDL